MGATAVIGLQWGDEAKGKIVDLLTKEHDIVVRYQGGANAGHTVVFDWQKFKLSLIPSGIFRHGVQSVIANGVVIDPASILGEIESLRERGVAIDSNLMISDRAHVIFPWHKEEDRLMNDMGVGKEAIGTTMRGIGPCYRDKIGRSSAIRFGDLFRDDLKEKIEKIAAIKNRSLPGLASSAEAAVRSDRIGAVHIKVQVFWTLNCLVKQGGSTMSGDQRRINIKALAGAETLYRIKAA